MDLPIDPLLPELVETLRRDRKLVLEAPPGAGKTTRAPRAILEAGVVGDAEIVVLEPRRIAARMAATRVARELGEPVGQRVGYAVRFEERSSAKTRLRFVTEGILVRMLAADRTLSRVGCVVFDEFHERSLHADLALALSLLVREARPDLCILPMSATLDGARVAEHLGCRRLRSEGRAFPVRTTYDKAPDDRPLPIRIAGALREVLRDDPTGHVLVFVPGAREIREAMATCERIAADAGAVVLPLHGELSPEDQDRAVGPSKERKVIVSTNVAESSVTIEGVSAVIDSGLVRRVASSPWSGLPVVTTEKVSRASAAQREGRAGRTREGVCRRLYTKGDHDARKEHDDPEIARADLAELRLLLATLDRSPSDLPWLDAPPAPALARADALLERLGAISGGIVTAEGRRAAALPLHPRLGALALFAAERGCAAEGALTAAVLGERDPRRSARASFGGGSAQRLTAGDSDVVAVVDALEAAARERLRPGELRARDLEPDAVFAIRSAAARIDERLAGASVHGDRDTVLLQALLWAFSDRVARRRKPGGKDLVLSGGGSATQVEESSVRDAPFVVVVRADETPRGVLARDVSAIEVEWLLELFPERIKDRVRVAWNDEKGRAEASSELLFDDLVIDAGPAKDDDATARAIAKLLARKALDKGLHAIVKDPDALADWLARARFVHEHDESFPSFDGEAWARVVEELAEGWKSLDELAALGFPWVLEERLSAAEKRRLSEWAPERLAMPSGRKAKISYEPGKPPYVSSRLQDFFGLKALPTVAGGRAALAAHLLAPSNRPVQVTSDLAGFWTRHYPTIRKELSRKYPKHAWPENPT